MPFALLLCLPLLVGFGPPVLTDRADPPLRLAPPDIEAVVAAERSPEIDASAALLIDLDSGVTLYSRNPNDPLPPASTAKLMTALLVLRSAAPGDVVVVSANAAATDGSRMGLVAGEKLSVEDLLYGLLLVSGNDASVALAEHVSSTQSKFVAEMNRVGAEMGLTKSHFENPHGLDAEGHLVSASDLLVLARANLEYPLFREVVATTHATVAGHELINTNELLGSYPDADGVKTGTTDEAGECLVASVTRRGHRLLGVLLGSADRYNDMRTLLDFATGNWGWHPTVLPDDALAWAHGADGRSYRLRSIPTSDIFVPAWQAPMLRPVRVLTETAVMTTTLPVGELRWTIGDQIMLTAPLGAWQGP